MASTLVEAKPELKKLICQTFFKTASWQNGFRSTKQTSPQEEPELELYLKEPQPCQTGPNNSQTINQNKLYFSIEHFYIQYMEIGQKLPKKSIVETLGILNYHCFHVLHAHFSRLRTLLSKSIVIVS
jgi:hypothetical protein